MKIKFYSANIEPVNTVWLLSSLKMTSEIQVQILEDTAFHLPVKNLNSFASLSSYW